MQIIAKLIFYVLSIYYISIEWCTPKSLNLVVCIIWYNDLSGLKLDESALSQGEEVEKD